MSHMLRGKTSKVHRNSLERAGFNFRYFTNTYTTKAEKVYFFCYEYGYLELGDKWFALVKKTQYEPQNKTT